MLSQCVNFGTVSKGFFDHWTVPLPLSKESVGKSPATVSDCDWRETQDMLDFQAFVATIKVKNGVPDVVGTGLPLSVILTAHHNLVTYGVPFVNDDGQWTNPGPRKTFFTPEEAIMSLATRLDLIGDDSVVTDWLRTNPPLDAGDRVPGMAAWVTLARGWFDEPQVMEARQRWVQFHELSSE